MEGLLEAWCFLASLNYYVSCLPNCYHCYPLVLAYDLAHDLGLGHDTAPVLAYQHWHLVHCYHFHCLRVNDEVDEGEYEQEKV